MPEQDKTLTDKLIDFMRTPIPTPFSAATRGDKPERLDKVLDELAQTGKQIGELLVSKGICTQEQLTQVAQHQARLRCTWGQALADLNIVPPSRINDVAAVMQRALRERAEGASLEALLQKQKLVTKDKMEQAKELARKEHIPLEQALLQTGAMTLAALGEVFRQSFDIGWVDLSKAQLERTVVNLVPDNIISTYTLLPYRRQGKTMEVAMSDPRDESAWAKLRLLTSLDIVPLLADRQQLLKQQRQFVLTVAPSAKNNEAKPTSQAKIEELIESDSTVKMVAKIVEGAMNARAADIHLEPAEEHLRIRYRIDGMMYDIMTIPRAMGIPTVSRVKVLAGMDVTERRMPQDGRMTLSVAGHEVKMRASTLPTYLGEKVVLRILSDQNVLMSLADLGLLERQMDTMSRMMARTSGMLLATGPIGSGKTTSLYAILHALNQPYVNIVTVEDPVEYPLPGTNQVQVDSKLGLDFAAGLRAILRQDANILMVGEIRDLETAQVAVRAALTGHLLLSTLHTSSAVGAVSTLRHMDVRPFLIASSLLGVVTQRLLRTVCPSCVKMQTPDAAIRKELGLTAKSRKKIPLAVGCTECRDTGYLGRAGIFEVLEVDDNMRELIAEGRPDKELAAAAKAAKMQSLTECGKAKVLAGETTLEEVMRVLYTE